MFGTEKNLSEFTVLLTVLLKTQAISGDRFEEQLVSWLGAMQSWNFTELLWLPFGGACLYPLTTRRTKSLVSWLGLARRGAWWWMLWLRNEVARSYNAAKHWSMLEGEPVISAKWLHYLGSKTRKKSLLPIYLCAVLLCPTSCYVIRCPYGNVCSISATGLV